MVVNLFDQVELQERHVVSMGLQIGGVAEYDRATWDKAGYAWTPIVQAAYHQHGMLPHVGSGTYGRHLRDVLREGLRLDARYGQGGLAQAKAVMRQVSRNRPMIVLVSWGHWVVVVSRRTRGWGSASDYTILDPAGHAVTNRGSTNYTAPYRAGTFSGYWVTVHGRLRVPQPRIKLPGM